MSSIDVDPLQGDIEAYCSSLDDLLKSSAGKYVLFARSELFKVCDSLEAALSLGYSKFGTEPFLVQRVEPLRQRADFHIACRP